MHVEVGDWVRFSQHGRLVTGVVEYIGEEDEHGGTHLSTDVGATWSKYILEVRHPAKEEGA